MLGYNQQIDMYGGVVFSDTPYRIVTHSGTAHGDDFLACCILAAMFAVPIERREPTESELNDPGVWVVDVGGRSDLDHPDQCRLYNFDHHHNELLECSYMQVLMVLGLYEKFWRAYRWHENVDFRDRRGVKALGEKYGLTDEQMLELGSPVHTALMAQFERLSMLSRLPSGYEHAHDEQTRKGEFLYEVMFLIGQELIEYAEKYGTAWERLENCERQNLRGHEVLINPSDDITATADFARQNHISVMASHDNRGAGWAILRTNKGEKAFDFNLVANDPRILFAHKGGFIAKTRERLAVGEVFDLIEKALV